VHQYATSFCFQHQSHEPQCLMTPTKSIRKKSKTPSREYHTDVVISLTFLTLLSSHLHLSPFGTLLLQEDALSRRSPGASNAVQQYSNAALVDDQMDAQNQNEKRPYIISQPLPNDVLFGRGRPLQSHCGNLRFHRIINNFREQYKNARKDDKVGTLEPSDAMLDTTPVIFTYMVIFACLSRHNQGNYCSNCSGRGIYPRPAISH
jgi:hypothetical protein